MKSGRTGAGGGRGVFMETREANQQGAAQASSHLWLGCLTFAWDDGLCGLAWFAHDGAGISPRVASPENKAGTKCVASGHALMLAQAGFLPPTREASSL
jgi:hypothetical protein